MNYYDISRDLHIGFGTVALLAFWVTAALRKGTKTHRLIGKVYLVAILALILTALPLSSHAFTNGQPILGAFLLYIVLITSSAAAGAWRAIRHRSSYAKFVGGPFRLFAWMNLLAGIAILVTGYVHGAPLLMGMSAIGILAGAQMLRFASRTTPELGWWLKRHYVGIVGSGVATHVAFLNLGLSHLVPERFAASIMYFSWFGPVVIGFLILRSLHHRYDRGRSSVMAGRSHT